MPGCRLKKPPDAAAIQQDALARFAVPGQWTGGRRGGGPVGDNWLASFGDAQLSEAVRRGHPPQSGLARGRVARGTGDAPREARRARSCTRSADLLARGGGKMSGDNSGLQGAALSMAWEIDLWGRVRSARAAATADAASVQADFEYARQSLAATVAKSWFVAIEAALQAEVARSTIRDNEELVRLAEARVRVGVGNEEDVFVARANVGVYRDGLRQIELAREQALRALELLLGRYPAAAATISPQLPPQPDALPGGLPSELLERRPDVIAAERRIAAAFNRVGEAKAARLPAIALTIERELDLERSVRARGSQQPRLEPRRQPADADLPRRRAQDAGRDPDGRAEAGGCGLRRRRSARLRRSGERARG